MQNINIKKIEEEKFGSIVRYLDCMLDYISEFGNLCSIEYEGKIIICTRNKQNRNFIFVEHVDGIFAPLIYHEKDDTTEAWYSDEINNYFLDIKGANYTAIRIESVLKDDIEQLCFFPKEDNDPHSFIEYSRFYPDKMKTLQYSYDVSFHDYDINIVMASLLHKYPEVITFIESKKIGKIEIPHQRYYTSSNNEDFYAKILLQFRDIAFRKTYRAIPKDEFFKNLEKQGYATEVSSKAKSLLSGNDSDVKKLQLLTNTYKNFIKEQ